MLKNLFFILFIVNALIIPWACVQAGKKARSQIHIKTSQDIETTRDKIIQFIWKEKGFPNGIQPTRVESNFFDPDFSDLKNLARIELIQHEMKYKVNSKMYLFHPKSKNDTLIIYHQGHKGWFLKGKEIIQELLNNDCTVLAVAMPLHIKNRRPRVELSGGKTRKLKSHDDFKEIETDQFSPLQYFIDPVVIALNHVLAQKEYATVAATGVSGGGWTITLWAAVDPRVQKSYPVAGSLPLYLRDKKDESEWGEYEQTHPTFFGPVSYLDLYILGSVGTGRRQIQILNEFDTCCFGGQRYRSYESDIQNTLKTLGSGNFSVFLDSSHGEHKFSLKALNHILNDLKK